MNHPTFSFFNLQSSTNSRLLMTMRRKKKLRRQLLPGSHVRALLSSHVFSPCANILQFSTPLLPRRMARRNFHSRVVERVKTLRQFQIDPDLSPPRSVGLVIRSLSVRFRVSAEKHTVAESNFRKRYGESGRPLQWRMKV